MHKKICILLAVTIFLLAVTLIARFPQYLKRPNGDSDLTSESDHAGGTSSELCLHNAFESTLLVLNFNFPLYNNIDILKNLYEGVFGRVVTCGPPPHGSLHSIRPDILFNEKYGHLGYYCMTLAMKKYPGFKGYMFANDDMLINWWTMVKLDRNKIWHGTKIVDWRQQAYGKVLTSDWIWWKSDMGLAACQSYYSRLKSLAQIEHNNSSASKCLHTYLANSQGNPRCGKGWADFFYVPRSLSQDFIRLSEIAYESRLFLEIAVHNVLRSLDDLNNFEVVNGLYLPDTGKLDYKSDDFWAAYNFNLAFVHPFKLQTKHRHRSLALLKEKVFPFKESLTTC